MPPKVKVSKMDIVNAAVDIVRKNGPSAINARGIAAALNCSTQPVFSNFATMDDLRFAVVNMADQLCQDYIHREVATGKYPAYKANGMAYIRFAKEEKELFKLLYMRDRSDEQISDEPEFAAELEEIIYGNTGLSGEKAQLFHLEMWAVVHGIASMFATGFLNLEWDLISMILTDCYQGLRKQYGME